MTSTDPSTDPSTTVHVVGAGLAGLAAAATVARAGRPVVVHEHRNRLGGRATTDERSGYRFNQGPHALYLTGAGMEVLTELGVDAPGAAPRNRGGRIVVDGTAHLMVTSASSLVRTGAVGVRDKVDLGRMLARIGSVDPSSLAAMTVEEWIATVTDRPRAAAVLHALVRLGSYADAPALLSAEVAVMQLQLGLAGVRYLDGGWGRLVETLAAAVQRHGGRIESGSPVDDLPDAAAVIVASGTPAVASRLTGTTFDVGPAADAAVLDLALRGAAPVGFALGVDEPMYLSDHGFMEAMSPPGRGSLSLGQYLAPEGHRGAEPDRAALRDFAARLGVTDDMVVDERYLHRMTTVAAIATADRGGLAGRPPVTVPDRPGVFVAGDWVGPVGHLADASLASARAAAVAAMQHLDRRVTA